jgi:hypothetical protein
MSKLNTSQTLQTAKADSKNSPSGILQRKCASCSTHTIAGERCEDCKNNQGILLRKSFDNSAPSEVPPIVNEVLNSSGQPLDESTRLFMEKRFGHDFSSVRVHTDLKAAESASAVHALAYTVGRNIVFGTGKYAPKTNVGQRLMAHELTHVVQQSTGQSAGHIQTKPAGNKSVPGPKTIRRKIIVNREMDADELVYEFVKQYYSYTTDAQIQTKISLWTNTSRRGTRPDDVRQGFVMVNVTTMNQTDFEILDQNEKEAVNNETNRRFWETTEYKPGQELGTSTKDKEMAKVWMGVRNAVLTEDKQRKNIESLPDDIKKVLFAEGADDSSILPDDYTQLLRIAQKLTNLSAAERQDYLARINISTSSLDVLERSIESYIRFRAEREKQAQENETVAKPLLGAEDIYTQYKDYKQLEKNVALGSATKSLAKDPMEAEEGMSFLEERFQDAQSSLLTALKYKGFDSIKAFEQAINAYRISFRTQAVNLALDVLARYDHMLFEERKKFQKPGAIQKIVRDIGATKASALYREASEQRSIAKNLRLAHEPKEKWWIEPARKAESAAVAAHAQAESEVIQASGNDPLVAENTTNREKLTGLDLAGAQSYLWEILDERAEHVRSAREDFHDDPDRIFKLPDLIKASMELQGIDSETVYGKIINDYIEDEKDSHRLSSIAWGIVQIALAFLVPVGGWVAAAAAIANAVISTHQAYSGYKEYEEQERDYALHFLSEEPSLVWVGIAIAAAALDLNVAGSILIKESSSALKALKDPLLKFSKDGDLTALVAKIEATDAQRELKMALEREAKASLEAAREGWKDAMFASGKAYVMIGIVDPSAAKGFFRALYRQIKHGVNTIAKLRANAKYMDAVSDFARMSGAERAELETAFEELKNLVKMGQAKNMDDASLLGYVDRWAINRGKPGFQVKLFEEMKAWKPLTVEQQRALDALNTQKGAVTNLYEQKAVAEEELVALRAKPNKTVDDVAEIRELENELSRLDPVGHPPKRKTDGIGKIAEAEKKLAETEKEAAKAQLTLYDRLRIAAPGGEARERALKGFTTDQIGALKKKPTHLQADHIVSVREISDMEGFANLPWKDQLAIVDMRENLIAMEAAANASKGDRAWRVWRQASSFYESSAIEMMIKREAQVRALIESNIKDRLSKLFATKP